MNKTYKGYIVHSDGRIKRKQGVGYIKPQVSTPGYHQFRCSYDGVIKSIQYHRFVWEAFNGEIPDGFVIDHIDNNKTNNALSNLRLLTHEENLSRGNQKFTKNEFETAHYLKKIGWNKKQIMDEVGMSKSTYHLWFHKGKSYERIY